MAVVQQLTLFEKSKAPAKPKAPKAKKRATGPAALARGEFEPVNPPNLAQDTALWLLGQRSIALQRGKRYVPASIKHPGKMQPDVAGAIIDTYTKPGEFIVDCMGGIGTTGVEGAERGRHVLCVELVRHWANVAYANAVRTAYRGAPGTMQVVRGDARELPSIVEMAANSVLTSPWFGHIYEARDVRNMRKLEGREDAGPRYDAALLSPPYGEALEPRSGRTENRVERLQQLIADGVLDPTQHNTWAGKVSRLGAMVKNQKGSVATWDPRYDADAERHQVDAVVSSPVYGDSRLRPIQSGPIYVPGSPLRPDAYPAGYDAALLSPPFGEGREPGKPPGPAEPRAGEWSEYESGAGPSPGWRGLQSRTYSPANNEGRQIDATLFSPPFGEAINQSPAASDAEARRRRLEEAGHEGYKFGPNSAQAQTQQYDATIMSPPFGPTQTGRGMALEGINGDGRQPVERGIGIAYDAMIASPAYGDIRQDGGDHQFGGNSAMDNYSGEARVKSRAQRDLSNVGNKKYGTMKQGLAMVERLKEGHTIPPEEWPKLTYLEDMALIYWGCLQVLKDGGLCILVLKDYRREKQRVDLVGDTITLMKAVGFVYHDRALAVTSALGADTKIKSIRRVKRGPRWKLRLNYSTQVKVVVKVSPFVRLNARKPEKNGGPVLLPAGEEVLVYRKEAKKR